MEPSSTAIESRSSSLPEHLLFWWLLADLLCLRMTSARCLLSFAILPVERVIDTCEDSSEKLDQTHNSITTKATTTTTTKTRMWAYFLPL
jgi:hypothetical protein